MRNDLNFAIGEYQVTQILYASDRSTVYRAQKGADGQMLILKLLNPAFATAEARAHYRQEYDITCDLQGEGIIRAYGIDEHRDAPMLLIEDFGGSSLDRWLQERRLSLRECLTLALRIAKALEHIHAAGVIHKDLNPSNIVWNPATDQLTIIDFGIAARVPEAPAAPQNIQRAEGTLPYMSPEQTGRMNRALDYRTDFYSLGMTLYELLTNQLPFAADDALEWVHCHIARVPAPPAMLNPEIPTVVSEIVLKLLAKAAEDRYQTAHGLAADLRACLDQLSATGAIEPFPLGRHDISAKLQISQKLYGRSHELQALLDAFERAGTGGAELVLLAGYSGIGKSSLIQEIHKPVVARHGYFISGKFDQYQRDIPYSAIVRALEQLAQQLLAESASRLDAWRAQLLAALGSNGQVIVEVIPLIERLIGPQPELPALGPTETQNRFNLVFQQFIQVFCAADHPLVIFLDDLQWADLASLKLIELLLSDPNTRHLLVLGAYRDNEVAADHPLRLALDQLRKLGAKIEQVALSPLGQGDVNQLIADSLRADAATTAPLSELVVQKTAGNPFFVYEFLKALCAEKLLAFDTAQLRWRWDVAQIHARNITDNVVDLLIDQLNKLPAAARSALRLAACIGNQFEIQTLAMLSDQPVQKARRSLEAALQSGFIQLAAAEQAGADLRYRFRHDRIQQAAYALIAPEMRADLHLRIGRLWLAQQPDAQQSDALFEIANQLNMGLELVAGADERAAIADLNLRAGLKAQRSLAYAAAAKYYATGIELLAEDSWERQYSLAFALHKGQAECAYLSGQLGQAEVLFEVVLAHARSRLDRAAIYNLCVVLYTSLGKFPEAVASGCAGLLLFGIAFPESTAERQAAVPVAIADAQQLRQQRGIDELLDAPRLTDPEQQVQMTLLMNLCPPACFTNQELYILVILEMVRISLRAGHTPASAFGYMMYAFLLASVLDRYQDAHTFGRLALQLNAAFQTADLTPRLYYLLGVAVGYWDEPLSACVAYFRQAYQLALTVGDFVHASYAGSETIILRLCKGDPLPEVADELERYRAFVQRANDAFVGAYLTLINQYILSLQGRTAAPDSFDDAGFQTEPFMEHVQHAGFGVIVNWYFVARLQQFVLLGNFPEALHMAREAERTAAVLLGKYDLTNLVFYTALTLAALYPGATAEQQAEYGAEIDRHQARLKTWAALCPDNFLHKSELLAAERARIAGDIVAAMEGYDRAIAAARQYEFTNIAAIASERAARFFLGRGQPHLARHYLSEARRACERWGAQSKVALLDAEFPDLRGSHEYGSSSRAPTTDERVQGIDILAVVRGSQAISSEIEVDKLLARLMRIVIEHAGAQKGALVLEDQNALWLVAAGDADAETVRVLEPTPLEDDLTVSLAMVNYVCRTHETIVLDDATLDARFASDRYIEIARPRSVLCVPIRKQSKLLGVLYLENNLAPGAFTPERVQILELLATQAATSLENARVYAELEQRVRSRTAELLHAREAAEAASRAKSAFLANMSHELRTPLNAILGFAQLMRNDLTLDLAQRENLAIIERSGEHLLGLINDVLEMSKIESGRTILIPNSFDLYRLLDDLGGMFRLRAEHKRLSLAIDRAPDVPQYIKTDERKLRQVLINLLGNAIKFTESGRVELRIGVVARAAGSARLSFAIQDTGVGIAPDELDQLFQPFVQTRSGLQAREGTGLGLPISRQFVQLMGGEIRVSSRLKGNETDGDHGSTFAFDIEVQLAEDIVSESRAQGRQVIGLEPGQPDYRVLVADDNADNRTLLRKILESAGFTVREANNGREAITLYEDWRPQLIWMDMRMPVMDGYTAIQEIKSTLQGQATIVIALTASVLEEERAMVLSAGCDDYLRKPFRAADIFAMLHKHLGVRFRYAQPDAAPAGPAHEIAIPSPDALAGLPAGLRDELLTAVTLLDIEQIHTAIGGIQGYNAALAEALDSLARDFKYDTIVELIQSAAIANNQERLQ